MALRPIDFLRIANPWLVGANVSRVVPVYVLNNLISPDFKKSDYLTHIKHLAFDADLGLQRLMNSFDLNPVSYIDLETTVMGLLAPERRIFRDNSKGGASESGALFPLLGGLTVSSASDDGLGKRFRKMYDEHTDNLLHTLKDLMAPKENNDPATEFTNRLLAGINGEFNSPPEQTKANGLKGFDLACARFVDNLISSIPKHNRIQGIRRLALGVFFVSIMKMVNGDWLENEPQKRYVFVFGGLPPGSSSEPTVRAASKSFINWIKQSHKSIVLSLYNKLGTFKALPKASESDALRQKVKQAFLKNSFKEPQIDDFLEEISALIKGKELSKDWCKEAVESKAIGFSSAEYARRVRNLSANIGFAGPDKGLLPRLIVDTPLLGVLVKGISGNNSMAYEDFVTKLSNDFGLVLGIGSDDSITEKIGAIGQEGYDPYELLQRNETLLRERLIRTGLARTYSDSHTEVYGDA
jgi:hypothetical protein